MHHKCLQVPTWGNKFLVACHLSGNYYIFSFDLSIFHYTFALIRFNKTIRKKKVALGFFSFSFVSKNKVCLVQGKRYLLDVKLPDGKFWLLSWLVLSYLRPLSERIFYFLLDHPLGWVKRLTSVVMYNLLL